ncbi:unnamed protein product, partial [Urochloa humidicola]
LLSLSLPLRSLPLLSPAAASPPLPLFSLSGCLRRPPCPLPPLPSLLPQDPDPARGEAQSGSNGGACGWHGKVAQRERLRPRRRGPTQVGSGRLRRPPAPLPFSAARWLQRGARLRVGATAALVAGTARWPSASDCGHDDVVRPR